MSSTHEVTNQPPPLVDYNVFTSDAALGEGVRREGAAWAIDEIEELGRMAGSEEWIRRGVEANVYTPVLRTHDRYGNRIDEVEFHRAWHELMEVAISHGLHASPWRDPREGAHVARAASFMVWSQAEGGHGCPVSMTYAVVPALQAAPELYDEWVPRFNSLEYDPGLRPASSKRGALCGMAMTEKQGGSDVRANTTVAKPVGDDVYELTGHKWFCSAPMCDAFLVLAQAPGGLTCFFMPRVLEDGTRNEFHIQRLKDKLGNRSNASSEVEFTGARARRVGEEGRGVPTIIEMVNYTRLDCVIGTTALMRQAARQALHHTSFRAAFGKTLIDQPLMRNVLADLAIESEAATTLMCRLAGSFDRAHADPHEANFRRLATAVAKYWVAKRGPAVAAEALECFGGNGFVEESGMPRIYREAPLNSIWEGSGNVNALDVLRAMAKQPESVEAFFNEISTASDERIDAAVHEIKTEIAETGQIEARARRIVERMALALQGALLARDGHPAVAEGFLASRLAGDWGRAFGTLPPTVDFGTIIERARAKVA